MTNSPEATTPDSSTHEPLSREPADAARAGDRVGRARRDTYDRLVEPRSANRLALERRRVAPDLAQVRVGAAHLDRLVLRRSSSPRRSCCWSSCLHQTWAWIPGGIITRDPALDARDPAAAGARDRLPAARRRPGVPPRHPVAAFRRRALRAHAARRHHPRPARPRVRHRAAQVRHRGGIDRRHDPGPRAGRRPRRCATTSSPSPRAAGRACDRPFDPQDSGGPGRAAARPSARRLALVRSPLSDGEWHRLHPLTPLLRGGLFLRRHRRTSSIANLRDRLVYLFLPWLAPDIHAGRARGVRAAGDPIDFIIANNLYLVAVLVVLGVLLVLIGVFYLSWRFHTFRITGDDVEVRSGILFRTQRRAPLDRVQGVNLTRPMFARLLGMAKLEVVGAGAGRQRQARVPLDRRTPRRCAPTSCGSPPGDASRKPRREPRRRAPGLPRRGAAADVVTAGITGLIDGDEAPVDRARVGRAHPGRPARRIPHRQHRRRSASSLSLVGDHRRARSRGTPGCCSPSCPALIGFGAYWVRSITALAALLDRADARRRADHLRAAHDDHRDRAAGPHPRRRDRRSRSCGARAAGGRSASTGSEPGAARPTANQRPVHDRAAGRHARRRRARAAAALPAVPESEWPLIVRAGHARPPRRRTPFTNTPRRAWSAAPAVVAAQRLPAPARRAAAAPRRDLAQARGLPARATAEHRPRSRGRSTGCSRVATSGAAHVITGPCARASRRDRSGCRARLFEDVEARGGHGRLERPQPPVGGRGAGARAAELGPRPTPGTGALGTGAPRRSRVVESPEERP